ncbi:MAG: MerR family transcriptional regulator [Verrucomicrobia bacterium]|nr:MerR family transcriptional regulator [Verrucomicrobiota bacterium]
MANFQQTKPFSDDFTGRAVTSGFYLATDKAIEFWSEGNVHNLFLLCGPSISLKIIYVKDCYRGELVIPPWTKAGLLEVAEITESNYQLYSPAMAEQAKRILQLQEKRFTLEEIRDKLSS